MASSEAKRLRAELHPSRAIAEYSPAEWRQQQMKAAEKDVLPAGVQVRRATVAGLACEWHRPGELESNRTILFLHGGGFVLGDYVTHRNFASRVALATGARTLVPNYRLAPEDPFPAGVQDAVAAYDALLGEGVSPSRLVVMGDSAGGGLAASLLLSLRDSGRPLPALGVVISPWTDLTLSGESYRTRVDLDPIDREQLLRRMAAMYVPKGDPATPLASPLFGDLRGLPPLFIQAGDHEVLLDDSVKFAESARAAGVDVEIEVWPEMWHGWYMAAPALPEANEVITRIGAYVRRRMPDK